MSTDLSPHARSELDAMARVDGLRRAEAILIAHQRRDAGSCLCGWDKLGKSHPGHQVQMLLEAGVLEAAASKVAAGLLPEKAT